MDFTERFNATEIIYQEVTKKVANPRNFFFTDTYAELRRMAIEISSRLENLVKQYIQALLNETDNPEFKTVCSHMSYTKNYLKKDSDELSSDEYSQVKDLLDTTVRLGLMVHLFLVKSPTREKWYKKVDIDGIRKEWLARILRSDRIAKQYNIDVKKLPGKIFDGYYDNYLEPVLRNDLGMDGFLKMKKQYDFFRKLFFSGVLLGLENDFGTRVAKSKAEKNK